MRHSVITQAGGSQFAKLRSDYALICDNNACAALLLDVFDWRSAQDANGVTDTPWMRCSVRWLGERLYGTFGDTAIKSALELLVEKGYVERREGEGGGRNLEYRLDVHSVESANALLDSAECIGRNQAMHSAKSPNLARASQAVLPDLSQTEQPDRAQGELLQAGDLASSPAEPGPTTRDEVGEIWALYVDLRKPRNDELQPQERRLIADALKVAKADEIKLAIVGNFASPFHQGQNDNRKKYNALSQIIKGRQGRETTRERIDFFIDIAERAGKTLNQVAEAGDTVLTTAQLVATVPQIRRANVNQYVQDILTGKRYPDRSGAVEWAAKAERMMREEFKVQPIFEGEGEDTRIVRWERIA